MSADGTLANGHGDAPAPTVRIDAAELLAHYARSYVGAIEASVRERDVIERARLHGSAGAFQLLFRQLQRQLRAAGYDVLMPNLPAALLADSCSVANGSPAVRAIEEMDAARPPATNYIESCAVDLKDPPAA